MRVRQPAPEPPLRERSDCIPPAIVARLEAAGLRKPVASFADPRLRYPNLLLTDGWQRQPEDERVLWRKEAGDCSQTLECTDTGWRSIRSEMGDRVHVLERREDGRVTVAEGPVDTWTPSGG